MYHPRRRLPRILFIQAAVVPLLLIGMFMLSDWLGWRIDHLHRTSLSLGNSFSATVWGDPWWYALIAVYLLLGNAAARLIRGLSRRSGLVIVLLGLVTGFVLLAMAYTETLGYRHGVRDTFSPNKPLGLCAYILIPTSICAGIRVAMPRTG